MTTRRQIRQPLQLAANAAELSLAVPQVVAHRTTRMLAAAAAGPWLNARDRTEFSGMVAEKPLAFAQSWMAMWAESVRLQQGWLLSALRMTMAPTAWAGAAGPGAFSRLLQAQRSAAWALAGKGLAPVHRKAVGNAKRLAATRLR